MSQGARNPSRPALSRRGDRRGAAILVVVLSLTVLMGVAALVIDMGFASEAQAQLHASAESAAHAGALRLNGTQEGVARAEEAAIRFAEANPVWGRPVILDPSASLEGSYVRVGRWEPSLRRFSPTLAPAEANAVRVRTRMNDLPAWFSSVVRGQSTVAASADAVAVSSSTGASELECFLPLAISSCLLRDPASANNLPLRDLVINPAGVDSVAWVRPGSNPNAAWLSSQIDNCRADGRVAVGDSIDLDNGVVNSVLKQIADGIGTSTTSWDSRVWGALPPQIARSGVAAADYGGTLEGAILVFDDAAYCEGKGGKFTETQVLAGFLWVAIYDVTTSGSPRTIRVRADTRREHRVGYDVGGPDYGVTTSHVYVAY